MVTRLCRLPASDSYSRTGTSGQTLSPQHAKLRPLAGHSASTGSFKSPTGKRSPAQAANPILKLSMQSSPEQSNQPRRKTSMTSVQHPVNKDLTPVSSKGVNHLSNRDAKLNSDTNISQMPCCSSEIGVQIAAAPVQLTLKTYPHDSPLTATTHTTGTPMPTPIITTGSTVQATYPLSQNKSASTPSQTVPGHQDGTSAVCTLEHGLLAPGQTPDSQEVLAVSTQRAEVSLDIAPQEAVWEAQGKAEITNAIIRASAAQASMPAATLASAAVAEGAVAQQVPDSLHNLSPKSSSDACSKAQQGQRSSGAPTSAETAARPILAVQREDYKPTSALTPQYISAGAPPATVTSLRAAVSLEDALGPELASACHTADVPASMQTDTQTDITGHSLPPNPLHHLKPRPAASTTTTSLLGQPLTAPAQFKSAANCPTDDEQAKQGELPEAAAVCMDMSDSATTSAALCSALALSLPAPVSAAAAAAPVSAAGLAGLVPHTSAWSPASKLLHPSAVPIKLEPICMPFNLMGPSMLPPVSPTASATSVSPHSRAETPHVGSSLVSLLLCCNNLCCVGDT